MKALGFSRYPIRLQQRQGGHRHGGPQEQVAPVELEPKHRDSHQGRRLTIQGTSGRTSKEATKPNRVVFTRVAPADRDRMRKAPTTTNNWPKSRLIAKRAPRPAGNQGTRSVRGRTIRGSDGVTGSSRSRWAWPHCSADAPVGDQGSAMWLLPANQSRRKTRWVVSPDCSRPETSKPDMAAPSPIVKIRSSPMAGRSK